VAQLRLVRPKSRVKELLRLLRSAADTLEPFSRQLRSNTRVWDGEKYALPKKLQEPDPYALMWSATLRTTADLLERQDDVTEAQLKYLQDITSEEAWAP